MGKLLISSGFLAIFLLGWSESSPENGRQDSQNNSTFLSSYHPGIFLPAEIDILNQHFERYKVNRPFNFDFGAIYLSTLFSHKQIIDAVPEESHAARRKQLLSCLYPTHEFS